MAGDNLVGGMMAGMDVQPGAANGAPSSSAPAPEGSAGTPEGAGHPPAAPGTPAPENGDTAYNRAMEALRKVERYRGETEAKDRLIEQLLAERQGQTQQPAAPVTPPYSEADLTGMVQAGDHVGLLQAQQANADFFRERDREAIRQDLQQEFNQRDEGNRLNAWVMQNLRVTQMDTETQDAVNRVASELRRLTPSLQQAQAESLAIAKVMTDRAYGQQPDLRSESVGNQAAYDGVGGQPAAVPPVQTINWELPNRGLSPEIIKKFQTFGLGNVLTKSADPRLEAEYQATIQSILGEEQATANRKKAGVYR